LATSAFNDNIDARTHELKSRPMNIDSWTLYWQNDNLESCIASQSSEDTRKIGAYWRNFASHLDHNATILDLATGNGAVPSMLLSGNPSLNIVAVDKAHIEPAKYLSQASQLASVSFLPDVDICELPFEPESFDGVSSQFGLEYAPMHEACSSAVRVLKKAGSIRLLMHHEDSEIVRSGTETLSEISRLLIPSGVMPCVIGYVARDISLDELEAAGQHYLMKDNSKTRHISGQIFDGINQVIESMTTNPAHAKTLAHSMRLRLIAEQTRLKQLLNAALNAERANKLAFVLREAGIEIELFETFKLDEDSNGSALIGWQLSGRKK
jgi:ubiquinone/menaquinone biosynthesis C-methylase UbiE